MRINLKKKVVGLAFAAALLPLLLIVIVTVALYSGVDRKIVTELNTLANTNIQQITRDVYGLCKTMHEAVGQQLEAALRTASMIANEHGGIRLGEGSVKWPVADPSSDTSVETELPEMLVGDAAIQPGAFGVESGLVDRVKQLTGMECSIYQRLNPAGDMLRVASSKRSGVGSLFAAVAEDGTPNPVVSVVLQGRMYRGQSFVQGENYFLAYSPLYKGQQIIGMLGVGLRTSDIDALRKTIMNIKVGKSGYVFVLGGKGAKRGEYLISHRGERDGESVWEAKDADGNAFVQDLVARALVLPPGEVFSIRYPWQNPGESTSRSKIAAVTYFEPWDWVISASLYEDDYHDIQGKVAESIRMLLVTVIGGGALILVITAVLALILGSRIVKPISSMVTISEEIATGNLVAAKDGLRSADARFNRHGSCEKTRPLDESGMLVRAFHRMVDNLTALIGRSQESSTQVSTSAIEIASSVRQLEAAVSEQSSSTRQVSVTSKEIAATSEQVAKTMEDVAAKLVAAVAVADSGQASLSQMHAAMQQLVEATSAISSKLTVISDKAHRISAVTTTIHEISDRTNLLSLNAAIEAEKAGQQGQGFGVVAREIRRLADQTAASTQDIERMIKEMQSSVSAGVMEMDKYAEEVRRRGAGIASISGQFGQVMQEVRNLRPCFENTAGSVTAQAEGARQISEAIGQLSESAQQTMSSLHQLKLATEQLRDAAQTMQNGIALFKVSTGH